jgi:hypothetical protein
MQLKVRNCNMLVSFEKLGSEDWNRIQQLNRKTFTWLPYGLATIGSKLCSLSGPRQDIWKLHESGRPPSHGVIGHDSQSREVVRYGYESRGARKQEWLCWRDPGQIYPPDLPLTTLGVVQPTVKCAHESRGTRKEEWLCWRRPAVISPPTDPSSLSKRHHLVTCKGLRKNKWVPTGPETKIDCADEDQQQFTSVTELKTNPYYRWNPESIWWADGWNDRETNVTKIRVSWHTVLSKLWGLIQDCWLEVSVHPEGACDRPSWHRFP